MREAEVDFGFTQKNKFRTQSRHEADFHFGFLNEFGVIMHETHREKESERERERVVTKKGVSE